MSQRYHREFRIESWELGCSGQCLSGNSCWPRRLWHCPQPDNFFLFKGFWLIALRRFCFRKLVKYGPILWKCQFSTTQVASHGLMSLLLKNKALREAISSLNQVLAGICVLYALTTFLNFFNPFPWSYPNISTLCLSKMTVTVPIISVLNSFFFLFHFTGTMFALTLCCQVFVFIAYSNHLGLLYPRRANPIDELMNKESAFVS